VALTKSASAVDAWAEIAQNAVREGTEVDVSDSYETQLHIDYAQTNETVHTGTKIIVMVSSAASGDEFWSSLAEWVSRTGTGNREAITNDPLAQGSTTINVASTTGYTTVDWRFIEDISSFANSEIVRQVGYVANTSITVMDGTAREHAKNSLLHSIAFAYVIDIPFGVLRVKVMYDNTYDSDGATVATRARVVKVTAV